MITRFQLCNGLLCGLLLSIAANPPAAHGATAKILPLGFNFTHSGTIALAGQQDRFTFMGTPGQRLFFDTLSLTNNNLAVTLTAPSGSVIGVNQGLAVEGVPFYLLEAGIHTLTVDATLDALGDYNLRLVDANSAPLVDMGTTNAVTLNPASRTEVFRFTANAGQRVTLKTVAANTNRANWLLYGVANQLLASAQLPDDLGTNLLRATGTYLIVVQGTLEGGLPVDFQFSLAEVSDAPVTATGFGVPQAGTVGMNAVQDYPVTAPAGTMLYYDALATTLPTTATVRLLDPDGSTVFETAAPTDLGPFFLPRSGTYTARVLGNSTGGAYNFQLLNVGASALPVTFGNTNTGVLTPPQGARAFSFTGAPGQRIYYDALTPGANDATATTLSAHGAIILNHSAEADAGFVTLTEPGAYFMIVDSLPGQPAADYNFRLIDLAEPPVTTIPLDTTITNSLDPGTREVFYRFNGVAGQRLFFDGLGTNGNGTWTLLDPLNTPLAQTSLDTDFTLALPRTGSYALVMRSTQPAPVEFMVRLVTAAATNRPLTLNTVVTNTLATAGEEHRYTFAGAAGQRLIYDGLQLDAQNITARLLDPRGAVFGVNQAGNVDSAPFTLPESGIYTLVLGGLTDSRGGYSFRLLDAGLPPVADAELNAVTAATNALGLAQQVFRVNVAAGQRLFFDSQFTSGNGWALYDPDCALIFSISASADVEVTAARAGAYLLVLSSTVTNELASVFRVLAPVTTTNALPLNTVVSNAFTDAGNEHRFTFTGTNGQLIFYDALDADSDAVTATLLDPLGNALFSVNADADQGPFQLRVPGTYMLVLHNSTDGAPDYRFQMLDVRAQPGLALNNVTTNQLRSRTQAQLYQFAGSAGQALQLQSLSVSGGSATWALLDPTTALVAAPVSLNDPLGIRILPRTGTYSLLVQGLGPDSGALDYQFSVTNVTAAPVTAGALGTFTGSVAAGATNVITFTANAGTPLFIDALTNNYTHLIALIDPAGTPLLYQNAFYAPYDNGLLVLPRTGTYQMQVIGSAGGAYAFRLVDGSTAPVLTLGATNSGSLNPGFTTMLYRFTGTAGQRLHYDGLEGDNDAVYVELLGPTGGSVFGGVYSTYYGVFGYQSDADHNLITLPETGTYYFTVISGTDTSNHYTFRLSDLSQPPTVPLTPGATNGIGLLPVPAGFLSITGSYVNANLRAVDQPDWRASQTIAGTRIEAALNFSTTNWGSRAAVGLTSGADTNWDDFSVQWDGTITITNTNTVLYLASDDGARMWIDVNNDGTFATSELLDNGWGQAHTMLLSTGSVALAAGTYRIRIQYEEGAGENEFRLLWDNGFNLGPFEARVFRFDGPPGKYFFDGLQSFNVSWDYFPPGADAPAVAQSYLTDFESLSPVAGTNYVVLHNYTAVRQPYSFRVLPPASQTNATAIGATNLVIIPPGQHFYFTFPGVEGQRLYYDALGMSAGYAVTLTVSTPDGALLYNNYVHHADIGPFTLRQAGVFTLDFENHTDTPQECFFRVLDLEAQPAIALDATNTAIVPAGAFAQIFRVASPAHLRLYADDLGSTNLGTFLYWTLYAPNDTVLGNNLLGYDFEVPDPVLSATNVLILSSALKNTFGYTFQMVPGNHAPVPPFVGALTNDEMVTLIVTNTATDPELPNDTLTYSLLAAPPGAVMDPLTGIFTWTPTEAQGPGVYAVTVRVTDDGIPNLSATNTFTIRVNEINRPPVLTVPVNQTQDELTLLSVSASATDPDLPVNTLTFSLVAPPAGMAIDPVSGLITWTPSEAQGPSTNVITVVVTDFNPDAVNEQHLSVTNTFTVIVNEVNVPPVLPAQTNRTIAELTTLTVTNTATDADLPVNGLAYQLVNPPVGAVISSSGVITWTPTEAQGPSTNVFTTIVTDTNPPAVNATSLSATNTFTVIVQEVNTPPVLTVPGPQALNELTTLSVSASATDADVPANALTFSLVSPPAGMSINASSGLITWTPSEAPGPSTNVIIVVVTDFNPDASNEQHLSVTNTFLVIVNEVNVAPVLPAQTNRTIAELTTLIVTNTATDADLPVNSLSYQLVNPPAGAVISSDGVISWTPSEAQGPSTNIFTTIVTDTNPPAVNATSLSATNTFTVIVEEVNVAPVLTVPVTQTINELTTLSVSASATDADLPANPLTFSLVAPPAGMSINAASGLITWTPGEAQGPSTNLITVVVTDSNPAAVNATSLSTTGTFTVIVNEVNTAPVLAALGDFTVNAGQTVSFTATASDADLPANALTFSLLSAPSGASISSAGAFTWRPPVASANSTNTIQVRVSDGGTPVLSDTRAFTIIVNPLGPVALTSLGYTNRQFTFRVDGPAGPDYVITTAAATNLTSWTDLMTNASPAPPFTFLDTNTIPSSRFYRVRLAP